MSTSVISSAAASIAGRQSDNGLKVTENSEFSADAARDKTSAKLFNTAMDDARLKTERQNTKRHERQKAAVESGKHLPSKDSGTDEEETKLSAKKDQAASGDPSNRHKKTKHTEQAASNVIAVGEVNTATATNPKGIKNKGDTRLYSGGKYPESAITDVKKDQLKNPSMKSAGSVDGKTGHGNHSRYGLKTLAGAAPSLNKEGEAALKQHLHGKTGDSNGQSMLTGSGHSGVKGLDKLLSMQKTLLDGTQGANTATGSSLADTQASATLSLLSPLHTASGGITQSSTALYQSVIHESVGHMGWNQSMSGQVAWMASQNIRSAELKLNPANLGSIEVRIGIDDKNVKVVFGSHHALVREAIEQSIPRLREMMAEQGLNLSNPDVSQQAFSQQQDSSFAQHGGQNSASTFSTQVDSSSPELVIQQRLHLVGSNNGAVDYYI